MNTLITFRRALRVAVLLAVALVLWLPVHSLQANSTNDKTMHGGSMSDQKRSVREQHAKMLEAHGKMIAEMKASDAAIADLVTKMKSAPQAQKVDLLADIVTRLVDQQTTLHAEMDKMHQMMTTGSMPMIGEGAMCPCMMDDAGEKPSQNPAEQK